MVLWHRADGIFVILYSYAQNLLKSIFSIKFAANTSLLLLLLLTAWGAIAATNTQPLTLQEAENLAIWEKFKLHPTKTSLNSIDLSPKVDQHSSHTQLVFDSVDFSPNTIVPNQGEMTVVKVGVRKAFSHDESEEINSQQAEQVALLKNNEYTKQLLLRDVRHDWLELYYWRNASKIIQDYFAIINPLIDQVTAENTNSHSNITDLLQAKLTKIRLNEQRNSTQKKMASAETQLGRWIGKNNSSRPLSDKLPIWPAPASLPKLQSQLMNHPLLQADAARIKSIQAEIAWTKELNKPSFEVGASYGVRQQDAINVDPKLNMISGEFSLNLPSHSGSTENQDTIAASNRLNAAREKQQTDSRNLLQMLIKQYRTWQNLDRLQQNTPAAMPSMTNTTAPPSSAALLQSQFNQLQAQLKQLRNQVDLAQARVELLYFEGTALSRHPAT